MIEAIEHAVEYAGHPHRSLGEVLTAHGGQSGWSIVGVTQEGGVYTIFFSRVVPATANTAEPSQKLSPEFTG